MRYDVQRNDSCRLRIVPFALASLAFLSGVHVSAARPALAAVAAFTPRRPPHGRLVAAGQKLQAVLDTAPPGTVLWLSPGIYRGPLLIRRPVTVWGPPAAIIRSTGQGTTVVVRSDHVTLLGFTVDGSGPRYDKMDAALYTRANDVEVAGLTVTHALFGLIAEESHHVRFIGNTILGDPDTPTGIRGDAIRFWEVRDSVIRANRVRDSRDIVVWYSPGNRIIGNSVRNSRYGTHFMYSSDSVVDGNRYLNNIVGVFIMYSHNIDVRGNILAGSSTADGMGLGVKESGNLRLESNLFISDNQGLYLDTSPFRVGDTDVFHRNTFALCTTAVTFHSSETRNTFTDNTFRNNRFQVVVEGRGNALGVTWAGNYFDDYRGYDFDHDGHGDVPYELRSLSNQLTSTYPELGFFRGTIALSLIDAISEILPLFEPQTVLVDRKPRMEPPAPPRLLPST